MKSEELFALIGEVDEKKMEQLNEMMLSNQKKGGFHMKKNWKKWLKIGAAAACMMAVAGIVWFFGGNGKGLRENMELSEASSDGVVVYYTNNPKVSTGSYDLVWLSEQDLFKLNEWNDAIFRGTVESIENIVCEFAGEKEYRGLVEIGVEKVYRGNLKLDSSITVLLPHAIDMDVWIEDSETISGMKEGMEGIFVAMKYKEDSIWQQNGETLALMDIAEYGFADGVRWMFLDNGKDILYAKDAYGSLKAENLNDVEGYVLKMLESVD